MSNFFISYSHRDQEFVKTFHKHLKEEDEKIQCWVDWEGLKQGDNWFEEAAFYIERTDAFVFVISPNSIQSSP
jgi:hypothetical protein